MNHVFITCIQLTECQHHIRMGHGQIKEALAYGCYASTNTFLPNMVNAVTLFYGATLRDIDRPAVLDTALW